MKPLISIIIPIYNRALIIEKTMTSILNQSYTNWECIIVDDGSTDETPHVVEKFIKLDSRIKYTKRPENRFKGANACRNYGFEISNGELINWFDSDDVMDINMLSKQCELLFKTKSNYVICQSKKVYVDKNNLERLWNSKVYSDDVLNDYISFKISWTIGAVLYKKSFLIESKLKFDENLQQSQEYDLHIKLLSIYPKYSYIETPLITIFTHQDSISYSKKNHYIKAKSSLGVKMKLLKNKTLKLKTDTKLFLLKDMYRVFIQSITQQEYKTAFLAYKYFLKAHFFIDFKRKIYVFKHFILTTLAFITYMVSGKGYRFLKFKIH
jgi:glycosyltransferase involved in cell wall biosynthesis